MFFIVLNQILKMCMLLVIGVVCAKTGLVDEGGNKALSRILLQIVNPLMIFHSFLLDRTQELVHGFFVSFLLAGICFCVAIALSIVLIRKNGNPSWSVEQFAVVYSNCGFIGIPLINALLGSQGVLYLTPYLVVFNILVWTHGMVLMTGNTSPGHVLHGLLTPVVFAILAGFVCFMAGIRIPAVVEETIASVSAMNAPMAMFVAGISLAGSNLFTALRKKRLYLTIAVKLLVIPVVLIFLLPLTHAPSGPLCVCLIAAACPVATNCTMFSLLYGKDHQYASELFAISTVISMFTIPAFVYALEHIVH